jgi:TolB-like protein
LATDQQRAFLQFVVSETVAGRADDIKGYTVATCVFMRKEDFNPSLDPVVSVQANKLWRALERYYLVAGKQDSIRIDIPKGTYVPTLCDQADTESVGTPDSSQQSETGFEGSWPSVMIRSFQNLSGDPELNYLPIGLASELAIEMARYQELRVLRYHPESKIEHPQKNPTRFVIDGSVRKDRTGIKVTIELVDTITNTRIWVDTHRSGIETSQLIAFEEQVARIVAVKTAGERGIIAQTLAPESRNIQPANLKTYEAIIRFYEYEQTFAPESFMRAMEALKQATAIEPDCDLVWSLLARLYGNIFSLDFPGFENPLEKAIEYAERGARINPDNQRTVGTLALIRFYSNELSSALEDVNRALELNPNSLFVLDGLAYIMILSGEWELGTALARKAMRLNPYYRPVVHYALWVDCLRQGNYDRAYLETMGLKRPAVF